MTPHESKTPPVGFPLPYGDTAITAYLAHNDNPRLDVGSLATAVTRVHGMPGHCDSSELEAELAQTARNNGALKQFPTDDGTRAAADVFRATLAVAESESYGHVAWPLAQWYLDDVQPRLSSTVRFALACPPELLSLLAAGGQELLELAVKSTPGFEPGEIIIPALLAIAQCHLDEEEGEPA